MARHQEDRSGDGPKGIGAETRVNALKLASEICSFAKRQGWCRRDPCEDVELPYVEPTYVEPTYVEPTYRAPTR